MNEFSGFYKKSIEERLQILKLKFSLSDEEISILKNSGALTLETADRMIENVIGAVHLPLGIATNFVINKKPTIVPMAVEEPSIIAAASNAAKLTLPEGFTADADEPVMIGQIQIVKVADPKDALKKIEEKKQDLMKMADEFSGDMKKYGGGVRDLSARIIKTIRGEMVIVEFLIDVRDAMGANTINTVLEKTAPFLEELIKGEVRLRILTNLAIKRKVRASAVWKKDVLGEDVIEKILDGHAFALGDIFRCSTHNKGILNGMDSVALATGNDWRAVESGAHSYAAANGKYEPLTHYEKNNNGDLIGKIELPLSVGTVGGAINTKPTPRIMFKIMGIKTAQELSMVMACAGLANNFAALKALATVGINKGHMKLHGRNIAVLAGAKTPEEIDKLSRILAKENNFSVAFAKEKLEELNK